MQTHERKKETPTLSWHDVVGNTKAAEAFSKLKLDNVDIQRDINLHDHVDEQQKRIVERLEEYRKTFPTGYCGYPPEIQLATVMALIELDDRIGFKTIADRLDTAVQHTIFAYSLQFNNSDPTNLMNDVDVFQQLSKQFRWIASYGCTRF